MNAHDEAVHSALTAVGLPNLKVVADQGDVAAMERAPGRKILFPEALRLALEAFLTNGRGSPEAGHDSALDVVRDAPESFGLGPDPTDAAIAEALRRVLGDDPKAEIVLLTPAILKQEAYRFPPEYGEGTEEHWVFRIIAPASWPFLQWAIVDPRGEQPAYSYMFD